MRFMPWRCETCSRWWAPWKRGCIPCRAKWAEAIWLKFMAGLTRDVSALRGAPDDGSAEVERYARMARAMKRGRDVN